MNELKKFLFDTNDFSNEALESATNAYSEEQFILAQEQSFTKGREQGIQETKKQQEEKIGNLLQRALTSIDALIAIENKRDVAKKIQAIDLSMMVIKKVLPTLAKDKSLDEIEKTIKEKIITKKDEPIINICVPEEHLEQITKRINEVISNNNYSSQININADKTLASTDCRIKWADGSIEKDFEDLIMNIEKELDIAKAGLKAEEEKAGLQPPPDVLAKKAEIDNTPEQTTEINTETNNE